MDFDVESLLQVEPDLRSVHAAQMDPLFASQQFVAGLVLDIVILLDHRQLEDFIRPFVDDLLVDGHLRSQSQCVLDRFSQFVGNRKSLFGEIDEYQPRCSTEQDEEKDKNADDDNGRVAHGKSYPLGILNHKFDQKYYMTILESVFFFLKRSTNG